jgi:hypothetical protein
MSTACSTRAAVPARATVRFSYQRVGARRGHSRAMMALGHSILIATWHMLRTGETYCDLGGDYFTRRDPDRSPAASSPSSTAPATPSRSSRRRRRPER